MIRSTIVAVCALLVCAPVAFAQTTPSTAPSSRFEAMDVFGLEWASDPQISPDGQRIVYVRNFMDVKSDRRRSNLWIVNFDGSDERPLTTGLQNDVAPRWSPDGKRVLYASTLDGTTQLFVRWVATGEVARLTQLQRAPGGLAWSPDGRWIAFLSFVPEKGQTLAELPTPPEGASWAARPQLVDLVAYRADGGGYLEHGKMHLFVLPAEGGVPRQVTSGPYNHAGTAWSADGKHIIVSSNRRADADYEPNDSELYEVSVADGSARPLTDRRGPDNNPVISPDGSRIAYLGFDDRYQGYQVTRLHLMNRDGSSSRVLSAKLDRDVASPVWSADGRSIWFQYDDHGDTRIATIDLDANVQDVTDRVGGTSIDRPYGGGQFSIARNGRFAFTQTSPTRPADVAVGTKGTRTASAITRLNEDLLAHKQLGVTEEIRFTSSHDNRPVQGWIVKPPGFDPARKYPLILEIHGGPFLNYGPRFAADYQLYAAKGYVVLYVNPRGSTSYGEEFGNLIHHAYPGNDYFDLMSGVDAAIARGYVDPEQLFITGGSGGGVLTSWSIGKTTRFRAAVVQKPVINWYSFVLTADAYPFFVKYWFPGPPWEIPEHYHARSPISLVGNVSTPTMLITGEADYRTPIAESEQYYQALRLRRVDAALVRIPGASHSIDARPSNLIAKAQYVLGWFEKYRTMQRPRTN